jgi:hypothetical protein
VRAGPPVRVRSPRTARGLEGPVGVVVGRELSVVESGGCVEAVVFDVGSVRGSSSASAPVDCGVRVDDPELILGGSAGLLAHLESSSPDTFLAPPRPGVEWWLPLPLGLGRKLGNVVSFAA